MQQSCQTWSPLCWTKSLLHSPELGNVLHNLWIRPEYVEYIQRRYDISDAIQHCKSYFERRAWINSEDVDTEPCSVNIIHGIPDIENLTFTLIQRMHVDLQALNVSVEYHLTEELWSLIEEIGGSTATQSYP